MDTAFSLVDHPWLPCLTPSGKRMEFGLRDVLTQAHTIREIRGDTPLVTVSLHRLLLAILHRNFGPGTLEEWAAIWTAGRFDASVLDAYFALHRDRFDLCHDRHPFYQAAEMEECEDVSISRLAFVQGNNATLFDHRIENDSPALPPAEAARLLVAYQTFAIGGGVSKPFNLCHSPVLDQGGYLVLAIGDNLFQTLCLNLLCYDPVRRQPIPGTPDDRPVWERDEPVMPEKSGTPPTGWLDRLTWQSRRIRLVRDGGDDLRFSRVRMLQGLKISASGVPAEPMSAYAKDKEGQWYAISLREGRSLWRDSAALMQEVADTQKPPEVVRQMTRLRGRGLLPPKGRFLLSAFGICSNKAKITFWRHETMPLPLHFLGDDSLLGNLKDAVEAAEKGVSVLGRATWNLALHLRGLNRNARLNESQRKELGAAVDALSPDTRYWARMEQPFREFLLELPGEQSHQISFLGGWKEEVCGIARSVLDQIVAGLDDSPRSYRAVYTDDWGAQKTLNVELAKIASTVSPK